ILVEIVGQVRVGHQVEEYELHGRSPLSCVPVARYCDARNSAVIWANSAGRSKYMAWPQSPTSANLAFGIRSAYRCPCATGISRSSAAQATSVGTTIRCSLRSSFGLHMNGTQQNLASAVE